jgi:hypothetical protein
LTLNHVCTPIPEVSEKRLIKTIGKEVQIDWKIRLIEK